MVDLISWEPTPCRYTCIYTGILRHNCVLRQGYRYMVAIHYLSFYLVHVNLIHETQLLCFFHFLVIVCHSN